jgi:hypothetical protein
MFEDFCYNPIMFENKVKGKRKAGYRYNASNFFFFFLVLPPFSLAFMFLLFSPEAYIFIWYFANCILPMLLSDGING